MMGFFAEAVAFVFGSRAVEAAEKRWPRAIAVGFPAVTMAMAVILFVWLAVAKGAAE